MKRCVYCGLYIVGPVHYETVPTDERRDNGFGIPIPFVPKEVTLPFCNEGCAEAYIGELEYEVVE